MNKRILTAAVLVLASSANFGGNTLFAGDKTVGEKVDDKIDKAKDKWDDTKDKAKDKWDDAKDKAKDKWDDTKDKIDDAIDNKKS